LPLCLFAVLPRYPFPTRALVQLCSLHLSAQQAQPIQLWSWKDLSVQPVVCSSSFLASCSLTPFLQNKEALSCCLWLLGRLWLLSKV